MKSILRLSLVCLLVFILANEPPKKQALAEVKSASEVAPIINVPAPTPTPTLEPTPEPVTVYHSDDFYKEYIFTKESNGRLAATNEIGCIGLGQDCNGQLAIDCPNWQTDLLCQLEFWDRYATARYGGWYQSYLFRQSHNWW